MYKEQEALNRLEKDNIDVQELFLKHLLDKVITVKNCGEYALKYTNLKEDDKWKIAKDISAECNYYTDFKVWDRLLTIFEFVIEEYSNKK